MGWCTLGRLASCNEIWSRPADRILDNVGEERSQGQGDEEAEDCDVDFVDGGAKDQSPEDEEKEWDTACVEEKPT